MRGNLLGVIVLLLLVAIPAAAYADPSGGALFQVLMPTLAAIWAVWLIFANRARAALRSVVRKLRGSTSGEPAISQSGSMLTEDPTDKLT